MNRAATLPRGVKILIGFLLAKLGWDVWTLVQTPGDVPLPKLGIALVLPFLIAGLARRKNLALNLVGVVCLFWIAFLVARLVAPLFVLEPITTPFPWSNLLALPAIVFVMNNLEPDPSAAGPNPQDLPNVPSPTTEPDA